MPTSIREFVSSNYDKVIKFEYQLAELKDDMNRQLDEVSTKVQLVSDSSSYNVVGPRSYNQEWPASLSLCRFWEIEVPSESRRRVIDLYLAPTGWQVFAFRRGPEPNISALLKGEASRILMNRMGGR